jgi:hypothetical protein
MGMSTLTISAPEVATALKRFIKIGITQKSNPKITKNINFSFVFPFYSIFQSKPSEEELFFPSSCVS